MKRKVFVFAVATGLLLHLLLLFAVQPSTGMASSVRPSPPRTAYLTPMAEWDVPDGSSVRTVKSPVMFSLPSAMGFSRGLRNNDVMTKLTFSQQVRAESFLEIDPATQRGSESFDPLEMMISARAVEPALPHDIYVIKRSRPAARRVIIPYELKQRLRGGIVLPPALNEPVARSWEIHASISVTEQGGVEHVFLDQPLESAQLNQKILQLLHGLRFKPGKALESSIEIYSAEEDQGRADE